MKKTVFAFAFSAIMAVSAVAQQKIVTVSMQQCFDGYHKVQEFQERRATLTEDFQEEARERETALREEAEPLQLRIQEIQENPGLNDEARLQQVEALQPDIVTFRQKEQAFQQWVQQRQQELNVQTQNMRNTLLDEIRQEAMAVGIREGADLVLDTSNINGLPTVIYADSSLDITNRVLARINRDQAGAAAGGQ